jgi:hypothetical protein
MKTIPLFMTMSLFIASAACADPGGGFDSGKDLCLLDINKCPGQSHYNIVEKIARLKAAIEIGTKVYTPEEVVHLKYSLEEALVTADRIDADPSQVPENRDR